MVNAITPNRAAAGKVYTGVISGSGFMNGLSVESTRPGLVTFSNITSLGATVSYQSNTSISLSFSQAPSQTGTYAVRVKNPNGQVSNPVTLEVIVSSTTSPTISQITPSSATKGQNYSGSIVGTNLFSGCWTEVQPPNLPTYIDVSAVGGKTTYKSSTELALTFSPVPNSAASGKYLLRVACRGRLYSNTVTFSVLNQTGGNTPKITSLSPVSATIGAAYRGTLTGTDFDPGAAVELKAPLIGTWVSLALLNSTTMPVQISRISATSISIYISTVPSSYMLVPLTGTHDLRVTNPNGKFSNSVKLTIK